MHALGDKGSVIDNGPFLVFLAVIVLAVIVRAVVNARYRNRRIEEAVDRHQCKRPVDYEAEWDAYFNRENWWRE